MNGRFTTLLAVIALATACGFGAQATPQPSPQPSPNPSPQPGTTADRSSLPRDTSPSVAASDLASLVSGNDAFALALHQRLVEPGKNLATSPFSISAALAMVWAGARGDTAAEMARALHFTLPQARLHPAFDALDLAVEAPAACTEPAACAPFTLRVANGAWVQDGYPFVPAYLDTLAVSYGAGVSKVDFSGAPEAARQTINAAVARETADRVRDLLPPGTIDASIRFVLTNAVYFKASWVRAFDPYDTAPGTFHLAGGADVTVPFMANALEARAAALPAYDAVELPYRDGHFAMTLIAPSAGTFETFERGLDVAGLEAVDAAMATRHVLLRMPKFKVTWTGALKDALGALGMPAAFDPTRADLSGITTAERLYLAFVLHQAFVAVNEEGTEAAAATAAGGAGTGAPPMSDLSIRLDRPFLFLIRDTTTGQIVFLGRVVDPR